jgi:serine/threonine-protein kinase
VAGYRADARVLSNLESPLVAQMYEYVESDVAVATVREYVEGDSVRHVMPPGGLRPEAALTVLKRGLLALVATHTLGVTHRG